MLSLPGFLPSALGGVTFPAGLLPVPLGWPNLALPATCRMQSYDGLPPD